MDVLVACEYSGIVRDAFRKRGHNAWSCDILNGDGDTTYHLKMDIIQLLNSGNVKHGLYWVPGKWDLMIAHPPCTHLAVSGARWFKGKEKEQKEALDFVQFLLDAPVDKIALENPVSVISTKIRKPDQIVQPWHFGDKASKATCLWLKNLPKLVPTKIVGPPPKKEEMTLTERKEWFRIHHMSPGKNRGHERSKTFQGFADAMAEQWG